MLVINIAGKFCEVHDLPQDMGQFGKLYPITRPNGSTTHDFVGWLSEREYLAIQILRQGSGAPATAAHTNGSAAK